MGWLRSTSAVAQVLRGVETFLYKNADAVVVFTPGIRFALVQLGVEPRKIRVIPNTSDPERFRVPVDKATVRDQYGLNGFVVMYAGGHGLTNGLDRVVDAAAVLADTHREVRFVLVGDGVRAKAVRARAARLRLANIQFLPPVAKREIPALFAAADVGLHVLDDVPLFAYGVSPNKLFDYMAAGLPVITNVPGETAHLVNTWDTGIAVAPDEIVSGVRALLEGGTKRRQEMGDHGRDLVARQYSRQAATTELQRLLDAL
jgi:glycosyltransferase involved in cell wall biosynthesis